MAKWIAAGATAIALAVTGWSVWRSRVLESNYNAARQEWSKKEAELLSRIRALESALADEPEELPPAAASPQPQPQPVKISVEDPVSRATLVRQLNERTEALAASEAAVSELQSRLREQEARTASLKEDLDRAQSAEKTALERLDVAQKALDTARAEAEVRERRLAAADAASTELRRRSEEAARKTARLARLLDELDDTARRQDAYLNSILRRYREVSDLYRTLALRLDNPREGPPSANNDLSRIQNAISLADEDLRQLRSLQAQAAKLQKEVAAARKQ
jgi:chromosome segregation ATPase